MYKNWWEEHEKSNIFFLKLTLFFVRFSPAFLLKIIIFIVVGFYFLLLKNQRKFVSEYRQNLSNKFGKEILKNSCNFSHFFSFASSICDKFAIWQGKISRDNIIIQNYDEFKRDIINNTRGCMLLTSHFGNVEIARALAKMSEKRKIYIIVYNKHAMKFNSVISSLIENNIEVFYTQDLDIKTMLKLQEIIEKGDHIAIMGDRIAPNSSKVVRLKFLNKTAPFSYGPYILASILKIPIYTLWCEKVDNKFYIQAMILDKAPKISRQKDEDAKKYIQKYIDILEKKCKNNPTQWYNFFDFWKSNG